MGPGVEGGHGTSVKNVPGGQNRIYSTCKPSRVSVFFGGEGGVQFFFFFFESVLTMMHRVPRRDLGEHSRRRETEVSWFCLFFFLHWADVTT